MFYIYGLIKFLRDIEFMMNRILGVYWKLCWGIIVPWSLSFCFIYYMATFPEIKYEGKSLPSSAIWAGWILVFLACIQVPIGMVYSLYQSEERKVCAKIKNVCSPSSLWGPQDENEKNKWIKMSEDKDGAKDDELLLIKYTRNEECEGGQND